MSYAGRNDGDPGFTRAIWCLIHHLAARQVVETGVAHGVTSWFVLEVLYRNDSRHLWSIDLPTLLQPEFHQEIQPRLQSDRPDIGSAVWDEFTSLLGLS
jgi:hypothetical protein